MSEPLAYHITWTTYGTWLPGDKRGWIQRGKYGIRPADPHREEKARSLMSGAPVILDDAQRSLVEATIAEHCRIRGWIMHAVNARSNHVHVVVTAPGIRPETVRDQFKAWCSRRLNERAGDVCRWWTEKGDARWIDNERYLHEAVQYVHERQ